MKDQQKLVWYLLAGIHVPFLITYLIQLPEQAMYWFGPVVWGILALEYFDRRTSINEVSKPWNRHVFICAIGLCMLLSFLLWSPSYGMLGAAVSMGWFLSTRRDRAVYSSMAYLSAVLFLTLRLPVLDTSLEWLNQMSVRFAGILLDLTGTLHMVTLNYGMRIPGRELSLSELTHSFLFIHFHCFLAF